MLEPIFSPLIALIGPFLLWPIEIFLPYPFIFEELLKLILVLCIISIEPLRSRLGAGIGLGLLFTASETILYTMNALSGSPSYLLERFVVTGLLHSATIVCIILGLRRGRVGMVIGVLLSMGIHYAYNILI
jgi:hypothetical protein